MFGWRDKGWMDAWMGELKEERGGDQAESGDRSVTKQGRGLPVCKAGLQSR